MYIFYACRKLKESTVTESLSVGARGQGGEKEGWIAKRHKEAFEDDKNICYLSRGDDLLGGCIC